MQLQKASLDTGLLQECWRGPAMTQQGTAEIVISLARDERTGFPALVVSALEPSGRTRHYAGSLADDIRQILAPAAPVAPPGKKKAPQPEPGGAAGEPPEA